MKINGSQKYISQTCTVYSLQRFYHQLDRGGLGREMLLKRQREIKETLKEESAKKRKKVEQNQRDNFRRHVRGKFAERQTASDLYKSQKACEQLDRSKVSNRTEGPFFMQSHKQTCQIDGKDY
mgnify:CR=1 FL=1